MTDHSPEPLSPTKRAIRALREMKARLDEARAAASEPIGIVGMACRFPGAAGVSELWELLTSRTDPISEVPPDRWNADAFHDPDGTGRGTTLGRWGGFLPELDRFDAAFFGISPREAPHVDPRQRLVLELAWEALEDAGIPPGSLAGTRTGVYVSVLTSDYDQLIAEDLTRFDAFTGPGTAASVVANRVSYVLDLRGPSVVLDTACSGSLVALDLACSALRSGEIDLAIAGGVSVNLLPKGDVFFSAASALSRSGRCRPFDAEADGIVRAEGAGLVVLQRASRATAGRRRVWAVIRASAVNHDGRSAGIMAPSGVAQEAVVREAYRRAGVPPGAVRYVEAHGTGTKVGDPVEVRALAAVLGEGREPGRACVLGSVKSNIGHTEAAAGVAGVIKTALALRHGRIPGNLHFRELNPLIPEAGFALEVAGEERAWPEGEGRRVAGVSGFGFGGTNAHVVMEEWEEEPSEEVAERGSWVVAVSGRTGAAAAEAAGRMAAYLRGAGRSERLSDVAWTAAVGREAMEARVAAVGATHEALAAELDAAATAGARVAGGASRLVFAFSGQGTAWAGMGRELAAAEPVFREALEACDEAFAPHAGRSLLDELLRNDAPGFDRGSVAQPAIFAIQVGLARLLESWGIEPDAVVGQSLGEVAAAHVAGALSLEDAARVVFHRSRLMDRAEGRGRTAAVGLEPGRAAAAIAGYSGLCVAGSTGPDACIVSGDPAALARFAQDAEARGDFCRVLDGVEVAFHSPQMEPLIAELERELGQLSPRAGSARFVSTVTASDVSGEELGASYWGRNLREPFRFGEAARGLVADGHALFVEIGPHPVLVGALRQWLERGGIDGMAVGTLTRGAGELESMQRAAAALWERGREVTWEAVLGGGGRVVSLPTYPFQRERFWFDQLPSHQPARPAAGSGGHPLLGPCERLATGHRVWTAVLSSSRLPWIGDHVIAGTPAFPAAGYVEMMLEAAREGLSISHPELVDARFERLLMVPAGAPREVQIVASPDAGECWRLEVFGRDPADADATWARHASGTIRDTGTSEPVDPTMSHAGEPIDPGEHYARMADRKLEYGPAFRGIVSLRRGPGRAVAEVVAPEPIAAELGRYRCHPALLDTALQIVAVAAGDLDGAVFLPTGIGAVRLHARPGQRVTCVATVRDADGAAAITADVVIHGGDGEVVAELDAIELGRVGAATLPLRSYEVAWVEQPLEELELREGRWLVLADDGGSGKALAACLEAHGSTCTLVDARGVETIAEAERRVAAALGQADAWAGMVYLWALDARVSDPLSRAALERPFALSCRLAIGAARALGLDTRLGGARLWLVTRGAQAVEGPVAPEAVAQAALWGLGRVLALEHPELWGGLLDLDPSDRSDRLLEALARELVYARTGDGVGLRGERRFVARLREARPSNAGPPAIAADGAYLVTGGLGGLGLRAARWLVERGARRLVLVGRSRIPPRALWPTLEPGTDEHARVSAIRNLERAGASVHYFQLDVGDVDGIRRALGRWERRGFPPIAGVVHAAGELRDRLVLRAGDEDVEAVLAKAYGAVALASVPDGARTIFYSSATAILGRVGQAAYAAANAVLDAVASARAGREARALSVNWGPWTGVGWLADAASDAFSGMDPITPAEGDAALDVALGSGASQALFVKADWNEFAGLAIASELAGEDRSPEVDHDLVVDLLLAAPLERRATLDAWVRGEAARVLGGEPERVDPSRPLTALGMDSMMAVELKHRVERGLGLEVSMVELFTSSVAEIAALLDGRLATDPRLASALAEIEALTDDEVEASLARENGPDEPGGRTR